MKSRATDILSEVAMPEAARGRVVNRSHVPALGIGAVVLSCIEKPLEWILSFAADSSAQRAL